MDILYLHQYFNTPLMSGGTRSYEMAKRLVTHGHRVIIITSDREPSTMKGWHVTREDGIEVHWYSNRYSNKMNNLQRVLAFFYFAIASSLHAWKLDCDLVYATSTPLTIAIPGVIAAKKHRVPLIFEVRDLWPAVPIALGVIKNRVLILLASLLERFAYKNSTHIVALAPGMKEHIIMKGVSPERITVIPNGCDINIFKNNGNDSTSALHFPTQLRNRPIILYAGTMGLVNGTEWIVRVAHETGLINPDFAFLFIGDGKKKTSTIELANELGVLDKNTFFMPFMPKNELASWYAHCNAAFVTIEGPEFYVRDSVCNKFFDAIAAGKPVLANHKGFSIDIAVDEGCGVVLPKEPKIAAEQIVSTLTNAEWMKKATSNAFRISSTVFSRDTQAKDLARILESALKDNSNSTL